MAERTTTRYDQDRLDARLEHLQAELLRLGGEVERMRELAALGELAAMIAHEVRNLMTPVVASAQRALRDPGDAARSRAAHERAMQGGMQAVGVADAILDMALDAEGGVVEDTGSARLDEAIDRAVASLGDRAGVAEVRRCGALDAAVRMSPSTLSQVLVNLMANAITAAEGGVAEITVTATRRAAGSTWNTPHITIDVHDSGLGVPVAIASTLFEPFVRAGDDDGSNPPTGFGGRGAGLGLAICRRLLERVGGSIELADRGGVDDGGARFRITLAEAEPGSVG